MDFEASVQRFVDNPEQLGRALMIGWYISLGMMVLGYLIIAYLLFF